MKDKDGNAVTQERWMNEKEMERERQGHKHDELVKKGQKLNVEDWKPTMPFVCTRVPAVLVERDGRLCVAGVSGVACVDDVTGDHH